MEYVHCVKSLLGDLTMSSDGTALTGLWLDGQKYDRATLSEEKEEKYLPIFQQTKEWLDIYFSGEEPDFMPQLCLKGTEFRMEVWEILKKSHMGKR